MKKISIYFATMLITLSFVFVLGEIPEVKAEKIKLTFATTMPPKSNLEIQSAEFVKMINEKTNGRIEITHYGQSTLYHSKELIPALAKNQVKIGLLHVAMVGRRSPTLEFLGSFGAQG